MAQPRGRLSGLVPLALSLLVFLLRASKIDEGPELAVEQVKEEAVLEAKFGRLNATYGIRDRRTLEAFFELFDLWIMLYRLNKADHALKEVLPACESRRDDLAIKAVQALAFTRWKQGRFREALARFHEMEGWMGKNVALCENIGHTYNAIGQYDMAERYFQDALRLTDSLPKGAESNKGGILLGLAGVMERRGAFKEALTPSTQAYSFYKERDVKRGWDSSLSAKAAMQLSKVYMHLGDLEKAKEKTMEAVRIFEETAGDDSPLVASALERLGSIAWKMGLATEAQQAFHRAYKLEAIKDAFDLVAILDVHNKLIEAHVQAKDRGLDRSAFKQYFTVVGQVVDRVRAELPADGNAGAYFKAAGELLVLGDDCASGRPLLKEAAQLFAGETSIDTTNLIKQSLDLVDYCDGTYAANTGG